MDMNYITLMRGEVEKAQSLNTLVKALEEAKENKYVDAVYLDCGGVSAGFATLDALRKAIIDFKSSGKRYILTATFTRPATIMSLPVPTASL